MIEKIIENFIENNDLRQMQITITEISIRDASTYPDDYINSDKADEIIELIAFISLLNQHKYSLK